MCEIKPASVFNNNHLKSECVSPCHACAEPVKARDFDGRWFITMGHSGFNSPANNRSGYESKESAVAAHKRYKTKGHVQKMYQAVSWVLENADDSGYPIEQAVKRFDLSDADSDELYERVGR